jgi:hypothetical protein
LGSLVWAARTGRPHWLKFWPASTPPVRLRVEKRNVSSRRFRFRGYRAFPAPPPLYHQESLARGQPRPAARMNAYVEVPRRQPARGKRDSQEATIPCRWRAYADWRAPTVADTGRWPRLSLFRDAHNPRQPSIRPGWSTRPRARPAPRGSTRGGTRRSRRRGRRWIAQAANSSGRLDCRPPPFRGFMRLIGLVRPSAGLRGSSPFRVT